jgi:tetratricopeptide (TPR) repeat protein
MLSSMPRLTGREAGARLRIFRDAQELSANVSLPSALRKALESSTKLIIVLSAESLSSKWVMEELGAFLNNGRNADIIGIAVSEPSTLSDESGLIASIPIGNILDVSAPTIEGVLRRLKSRSIELKALVEGMPEKDIESFELAMRKKRTRRRLVLFASATLLGGAALYALGSARRCAEVDALVQEKLVKRNLFDVAIKIARCVVVDPKLHEIIEGYVGSEGRIIERIDARSGPKNAECQRSRDSILGNISLLRGDIDAAIEHYAKTCSSWKSKVNISSLGDVIDATSDILSLGDLEALVSRHDDSVSTYDEAIELNSKFLDRRNDPGLFGKARLKTIDALAALGLVNFAQSGDISIQIIKKNIASARLKKANVLLSAGQCGNALREYSECIGVYSSIKSGQPEYPKIEAYQGLCATSLQYWNLASAGAYTRTIEELLRDHPAGLSPDDESRILMSVHKAYGDIYVRMRNYNEALDEYLIAKRYADALACRDDVDWLVHSDWISLESSCAKVLMRSGRRDEAIRGWGGIIKSEKEILDRNGPMDSSTMQPYRGFFNESRSSLALALLFCGRYAEAVSVSGLMDDDLDAIAISIVGNVLLGDSMGLRDARMKAKCLGGGRLKELEASCQAIIRDLSCQQSNLPEIEAKNLHDLDVLSES